MRYLASITMLLVLGCGAPLEPVFDAGPETDPGECAAVGYSPWERPEPFFCAQPVEHYKHCGLYGGTWARCADGCHLCIVPGSDAGL